MDIAEMGMIGLRVVSLIVGVIIVISTIVAAVKAFVMPRAAHVWLIQFAFTFTGTFFKLRMRRATSYKDRDRIMALYSPLTLLFVPFLMLSLVLFGYMFIYWSLGDVTMRSAFRLSGSALLTLGNAAIDGVAFEVIEFSEAMLGLILVALIIAYLPTMYNAFTRRESAVALLEVRAGTPPSPWMLIMRSHRNNELDQLRELWSTWQVWFAEIEESHTSLPPLIYFRSPRPELSWITAAGVVLDSAALMLSTIDAPYEPRAPFCIRSGFLALRQIASFMDIDYDPSPAPYDPISISRDEYNAVLIELAEAGVPLKEDRDKAWQDFAGWRVNYDTVLIAIAARTLAPYAPWSSDRSLSPTAARRKV
ncbi:MAG: hypothetical protein R3C44_07930 [Chloroflexota bacterium]